MWQLFYCPLFYLSISVVCLSLTWLSLIISFKVVVFDLVGETELILDISAHPPPHIFHHHKRNESFFSQRNTENVFHILLNFFVVVASKLQKLQKFQFFCVFYLSAVILGQVRQRFLQADRIK
jgi:hypothetical protein